MIKKIRNTELSTGGLMSKTIITILSSFMLLLAAMPASIGTVRAQGSSAVLADAEASKLVPAGFYFQGQSAPTQMRNSAVARLAKDRHVIAGLVDTAGYSSDVKEKYIGFLITDSPIMVGGRELTTGAYGFGFTSDGKINIFDVGGKQVLSAAIKRDESMKRPRPLMMSKSSDGIRLYHGKDYLVVGLK